MEFVIENAEGETILDWIATGTSYLHLAAQALRLRPLSRAKLSVVA
jgi:hypothetical protein